MPRSQPLATWIPQRKVCDASGPAALLYRVVGAFHAADGQCHLHGNGWVLPVVCWYFFIQKSGTSGREKRVEHFLTIREGMTLS